MTASASAQVQAESSPAITVVTAIDGPTIDRAILVGASGELYHPVDDKRGAQGTRAWRRQLAGGVAADVRSAVSPAAGEFVVAGAKSPLYQLHNGAWQLVRLGRRGAAHVAEAGDTAVALVGRHMYIWRDGAWRPLGQTRGRANMLWASSTDRVYVALERGALDKWQKGRWSRVRLQLAKDDHIRLFAGRPGQKLYAFSKAGALLDVGASSARDVTVAANLSGFSAQAAVVAKDGTLWVAGVQQPVASALAAAATEARIVLARRATGRADKLVLAEVIAGIEAREPVTVLTTDDAGALLLVTRSGQVLMRGSQQTWQRGLITAQLPHRVSQPSAGPARTR